MSVKLEQIDMLKERAKVSYEEAKEVLEKCNYDIVDALIYLEKQDKVRTCKKDAIETSLSSTSNKVFAAAKKLFKKGNETKFVVRKHEKNVVDLPVNAVILATVIAPPVTVVGVLGAWLTSHKIRFAKPDGGDMAINKTLDKISHAVTDVSNQVVETINKPEEPAR